MPMDPGLLVLALSFVQAVVIALDVSWSVMHMEANNAALPCRHVYVFNL